MPDFYHEFGARVRDARERVGLSQAELAKRIGLSRTSVTNIESGSQRALLHYLVLIAAALGTEPRELLPTGETDLVEVLVPATLRKGLSPDEDAWVRAVVRRSEISQEDPR